MFYVIHTVCFLTFHISTIKMYYEKTIMKHLVPNVRRVLWSVLMYFKFFIFLVVNTKFLAPLVPSDDCHINRLLFVKQQFLVTHTLRQTEFGLRTHLLSKCCFHRKTVFRKNITCLSFGLLQIGQLFLSPVKLCIGGLRQIAVSWAIYPLPRYLNCVVRSKIGLCNGPVNPSLEMRYTASLQRTQGGRNYDIALLKYYPKKSLEIKFVTRN